MEDNVWSDKCRTIKINVSLTRGKSDKKMKWIYKKEEKVSKDPFKNKNV